MRARAFRFPLLSLAAVASLVGTATSARAQAVSDRSSLATAPLVFSSSERLYTAGAVLGDEDITVKVGLSFGPRDDDASVLRLDMSKAAAVRAAWGDGKTITLTTTGAPGEHATLRAHYQLAPTVDLTIDAGRILGKFTYAWNTNELMNQLLYGANFEYEAGAEEKFGSWAWDGASLSVPGAPIANSKLLATPFSAMSGDIEGEVFVAMTTTPRFMYRTTSVQLDSHDAFDHDGMNVQVPVVDADFLEVTGKVRGRIEYDGVMTVWPKVSVTNVLGVPLALAFDLGSGKEFTYGSAEAPGVPVDVSFPPAVFHLPLPNVKVRTPSVDVGLAPVGGETVAKVAIENTGEMAAAIEIESSDPQFKVTRLAQIPAKSKKDVEVRFVAANAGPKAATLTLKSNDPDQPVAQIKVTANGAAAAASAAAPGTTAEEGDEATAGSPSGCGCVTAGARGADARSGFATSAALLVGLGAILARRRRR